MSDNVTHRGGHLAVTLLQLFLCVFGLVVTILEGTINFYANTLSVVLYVIVLFFVLYGRRLAHGPLFRFTLFAYALLLGFLHVSPYITDFAMGLVIGCVALIAYMAGRLDHRTECTVILLVVFVLLLVNAILACIYLPTSAGAGVRSYFVLFNQPIVWACFSLTYLTRYFPCGCRK